MVTQPRCRRCWYLLHGRSVDDQCAECGLPIAESFERRPSIAMTVALLLSALAYPGVMMLVMAEFSIVEPFLFAFALPACIFAFAFVLSAAGYRPSKWSIIVLILVISGSAGFALWIAIAASL